MGLRTLLQRWVAPADAARRDELARLRTRYDAAPTPRRASAEERALALRLRELRQQLSAALGVVRSCGGCAAPCDRRAGWFGGRCCSGRTDELFDADEVYALKLSGTRLAHLAPPADEQRGCAFRGVDGCSLQPAHRPTLCTRYLCAELTAELQQQRRRHEVKLIGCELRRTFEALIALRRERELDALLGLS